MGSAHRNMLPDVAGYIWESGGVVATEQTFDGIAAIQEHLEHKERLKDYFCARTRQIPDVPLKCYAECQVAQWSHSESVKECANRALIESACKSCEQFHEIASQSVQLTQRDLPEPVSVVLQSALDFETTSAKFLEALAKLYVECKMNQ